MTKLMNEIRVVENTLYLVYSNTLRKVLENSQDYSVDTDQETVKKIEQILGWDAIEMGDGVTIQLQIIEHIDKDLITELKRKGYKLSEEGGVNLATKQYGNTIYVAEKDSEGNYKCYKEVYIGVTKSITWDETSRYYGEFVLNLYIHVQTIVKGRCREKEEQAIKELREALLT